MKTHKIVCIVQIYNEIEKGNLFRFFENIKNLVDAVVVYDDCSTDGSYEFALNHASIVIRGRKNSFSDEMSHKKTLLNTALLQHPDFILWLDADEVLTVNAKEKLQDLCDYCVKNKVDGLAFHMLNLWRSSTWRRVDSLFDDGWPVKLWRVNDGMAYKNIKTGLHQSPLPDGLIKLERNSEVAILHYGFADKKNLAYKYLTYKSHGQQGYEMLDRIINEDKLTLELVSKDCFPDALWVDEVEPVKIPFADAINYVYQYKADVFRPKYSIICLIYKSVNWLEFVREQVLKYTNLDNVEFFFVANDASHDVLSYLRGNYIPHYSFQNTIDNKKEWYINNVYRAYNYGAQKARGDFIIFINSDMAFSHGWMEALISAYDGESLVASRLVESGKLQVGEHGIEKCFGYKTSEYREDEFNLFAKSIKEEGIKTGGLFMPLFVSKKHFDMVGGYPEGNIVQGSDIFNPIIAKQGDKLTSGDMVLMQKMHNIGISHKTAMSSVVYHFQEGEKDDSPLIDLGKSQFQIAICNDICLGVNGERVLWNYLKESLDNSYIVDKNIVGYSDYEYAAKNYINNNHPSTKVIIQNASFISTIDSTKYTILMLQDDLRQMGRMSSQQEMNLKLANKIVTNSPQTTLSYPEYQFEIIPVGVDSDLFNISNKQSLREKYLISAGPVGIFVGSLSEVKGWGKVKHCIEKFPKITWIVVTKYDEHFYAENVLFFSKIEQLKLSELLNCADFFIIGSPVETQCLAAIEANFCNVPVVMPLVGIYKDFSEEERALLGIFDDNLDVGVKKVLTSKFEPRKMILSKGLTIKDSMEKWRGLVEKSFEEILAKELSGNNVKREKIFLKKIYLIEYYVRKYIFMKLFGKRYLNVNIKQVKKYVRLILLKLHLLELVKFFLKG